MSRAASASRVSSDVTCLMAGWSAGAELSGVGVRCRMECRLREGVRAMKGMWKTLAERLGGGELVWGGFGRGL